MKIQSKKYEGVRSKELSGGDIAFYVRWTDRNGKRIEIKVGTKNQGWNEKKAYWKKVELQNKEEKNMIIFCLNRWLSDTQKSKSFILNLHLLGVIEQRLIIS